MAMIICPECGKEVSDQAKICVNCGYNIKKYNKKKEKNIKSAMQTEQKDLTLNDEEENVCNIKKKCFSEKKKIWFIASAVVLLAIVCCLIIFLNSYNKNKIPDIIGLSYDEAVEILNDKGIHYNVQYQESDTYSRGTVSGQGIKAGKRYTAKTDLTVYVSSKLVFDMPQIVGKKYDEVKAEYPQLNFVCVYEYTDDIEKGIIYKSDKEIGEKMSEDDNAVIVMVSKGVYTYLPKLEGLAYEEATQILKRYGLKYKIKEDFSFSYEKGKVIKYFPEKYGNTNETITLYISKGEGILIPNVVGETKESAVEKLENIKYTVNSGYYNMTTDCEEIKEKVVKQNLSGRIEDNSTVTLTVSEPAVKISQINFSIGYYGGVNTTIKYQNVSDKQIAYIKFVIRYYDRMGYPAECEVKHGSFASLTITGPINAGKTGETKNTAVIYNNAVALIRPISALITFSDGTTQELTYDTVRVWYDKSYYGGDLHE